MVALHVVTWSVKLVHHLRVTTAELRRSLRCADSSAAGWPGTTCRCSPHSWGMRINISWLQSLRNSGNRWADEFAVPRETSRVNRRHSRKLTDDIRQFVVKLRCSDRSRPQIFSHADRRTHADAKTTTIWIHKSTVRSTPLVATTFVTDTWTRVATCRTDS